MKVKMFIALPLEQTGNRSEQLSLHVPKMK